MATKHDWNAIRKAYEEQVLKNNVTLKDFSEEQGVSYSYMRKMTSQWQQDREIAEAEFRQAVLEDTRSSDTMTPKDRNMFHIDAYQRALNHCMTILDDPETHLMTKEGVFKPANLERVVATIEKCQRGQRLALGLDKEMKEAKGLLSEISDAINAAKDAYEDDVEDDV